MVSPGTPADCLVGVVVKVSALRAADLGSNPAFHTALFFRSNHLEKFVVHHPPLPNMASRAGSRNLHLFLLTAVCFAAFRLLMFTALRSDLSVLLRVDVYCSAFRLECSFEG